VFFFPGHEGSATKERLYE